MRTLALAVAAALILGGCHPVAPGLEGQQRTAESIEQTFPVLEDLGVTFFIQGDGCRGLGYPRGLFLDDEASGNDGLCFAPGASQPFDAVADADFARVVDAFKAADTDVRIASQVLYDGSGRLRGASFQVWRGQNYFFDGGGSPPMDWNTDTSDANQVSDHWWFAIDNWN